MEAFVAASDLPKSPGHPFYTALIRLLAENGFDAEVEKLCAPSYAETFVSAGRAAGRLLPDALRWVLRGLKVAPGDLVAVLRQPVARRVPRPCRHRSGAEPLLRGDIRLIAFITDPGPIRKILAHLGEPLEPPPDFSARHRYPQPLTAFHATVRTAREKSGFKAGSSRRDKSGLERG
jgi:hypothetical protein